MNATKKLIGILLALLCMLCAAGMACAETPSAILINQFEQNADEVTIYLNVVDSNNFALSGSYRAEDFVVNVSGSQDYTPDSAATVAESSTPVLYALGFDIGKNELASVQDAVNDLINNKKTQDRVMMVKLGDELVTVQTPTADVAMLQGAVGQLDQNCTSTYQGVRQFMLDVAAVRQPNERVVIVLFTDGLDNGTDSTSEYSTLQTIMDIRIPVYTIGMKNTDEESRFGYFTRIADYSDARVFTEDFGNATQSLQAVRNAAQETVALKLRLPYEYFASSSTIIWKAMYNANGLSLASKPCSYALSSEGVAKPTPVPEVTATPTVTNHDDEEEEKSLLDELMDVEVGGKTVGELLKRREVQIVLIAVAALLVLIIVIIIAVSHASRRRMEDEGSGSTNHGYDRNGIVLVDPRPHVDAQDDVSQLVENYIDVEKTNNPYAETDENTVNPYSEEEKTVNPYSEEEKTIAPVYDPPVRIRFDVDTREEPPFVKEVSFTNEMTIGRHKDCELVLAPRYVSRYHFKLTKTEQGVFIYNQKAADTAQYVMLDRVTLGEKELQVHDGALLEISRTQVKIHILSDEEGKKA